MWKIGVLANLFLGGCATMEPEDFAGGEPEFDPVAFFEGKTASTGVIENRRGEPVKRVRTWTEGRMVDGTLGLEQDLEIGEGEKSPVLANSAGG